MGQYNVRLGQGRVSKRTVAKVPAVTPKPAVRLRRERPLSSP